MIPITPEFAEMVLPKVEEIVRQLVVSGIDPETIRIGREEDCVYVMPEEAGYVTDTITLDAFRAVIHRTREVLDMAIGERFLFLTLNSGRCVHAIERANKRGVAVPRDAIEDACLLVSTAKAIDPVDGDNDGTSITLHLEAAARIDRAVEKASEPSDFESLIGPVEEVAQKIADHLAAQFAPGITPPKVSHVEPPEAHAQTFTEALEKMRNGDRLVVSFDGKFSAGEPETFAHVVRVRAHAPHVACRRAPGRCASARAPSRDTHCRSRSCADAVDEAAPVTESIPLPPIKANGDKCSADCPYLACDSGPWMCRLFGRISTTVENGEPGVPLRVSACLKAAEQAGGAP